MKINRKKEATERNYWIWITRPKYYLDFDGSDREDLDPKSKYASDDWWTCSENTKRGDLAFLYRARGKSDIGYLLQAKSNFYPLEDDEDALENNWPYGCDYKSLYKFENPVTFKELNAAPYLDDWSALRKKFQGISFPIPSEHWRRINELISQKNPGYQEFLKSIEKLTVSPKITSEEELEKKLVRNLGKLRPFGFNLTLYKGTNDSTPGSQLSGRQLVCTGMGGRIDLLCHDDKKNRYVVIELKNTSANQNAFAQISAYMGWVKKRIAKRKPVLGLIISRGLDTKVQSALKTTKHISQINLEKLGFK